MKLKIRVSPRNHHTEMVCSVAWTSSNECISVSDDKRLLRWSSDIENVNDLTNTGDAFCTSMHCFSRSRPSASSASSSSSSASGSAGTSLVGLGFANGALRIVNGESGRVEHTANASEQHQGAVTSVRWSPDGAALVSVGEDGRVLQWSRSARLQSKLTQVDTAIYAVTWSPDGQAVLFTTGQYIVIKPLKVSSAPTKWRAHSGLVLSIDWSALTGLIVSGGEDGRYCVFDEFGRQLYASSAHDYAITSVQWCPNGQLFAAGTLDTIILCDKTGWAYSRHSVESGSLLSLCWTTDGTHLAGAGANGTVVFAQLVDRSVQWKHLEAVLNANNHIVIQDVLNESHFAEELEFSDHVVEFSMGFGHLVAGTNRQCYVYSVDNLSTPHIFDLKGKLHLIVQTERYFVTVDSVGGVLVHTYEGRQVCNPRIPGLRTELLRHENIAVNVDTIAIIDRNQNTRVLLLDVTTGKKIGNPLEHNEPLQEVSLSQSGPSSDRKLAFVDRNADLYIAHTQSKRQVHKLASMCESAMWNAEADMLAAVVDGKAHLWYYPNAAFVDSELLASTRAVVGEKLSKGASIASFHGTNCRIRRNDGALLAVSVSPYPALLAAFSTNGKWNQATRVARFVDEEVVWSTLAAMSLHKRELDTAEVCLAAIEAVDKLQHIQAIKKLPLRPVQDAEIALMCHRPEEAEQTLLQQKMYYRAIELNLRMFRFERALAIAQEQPQGPFVSLVLAHRIKYMNQFKQKERSAAFLKACKSAPGGGELDWDKVKQIEEQEHRKEGQKISAVAAPASSAATPTPAMSAQV